MTTKTDDLLKMAEAHSAENYHPLPVVLTRGEGCWVWDVEGKKYLDMLSSYSALNQGHCHPRIIAALNEQAGQLTLTSRAFHNDLFGPLVKRLTELTGLDKALPMNTGAEGVETAIKMARRWGYEKKGIPEDKAEIVVFENNFHGRTTTIVGFSSEAAYQRGFGPFTPGFKIVPYGDMEAVRGAVGPNTCAVLIEPIQGEGGILIPPAGYLTELAALCREQNVLFVADEIQTGLGRTGKPFAWQHEPDAAPDAIILGKALGGGVYPVSAVVARADAMDVFDPGSHGSTFGGNPLACRVALTSLDVLVDEGLVEKAAASGAYFMEKLREIGSSHVTEVRGRGLLIGVEVKAEAGGARPFCERLKEEGILCKETHELVIRFAPPLVIDREEMDWALARVEKVLTE